MRRCNKCNKNKPNWNFKTPSKKTCSTCEFRFKRWILRRMVESNRLTPLEKITSRVGYMGVGFLIAGQWTVEPVLFIMGFICVLFQVASRKQWNLVLLQLNGLVAWTIHFIKNLI